MANIIQDKIDKLLPFLRGYAYDQETMMSRYTVLFKSNWDYTTLAPLVIQLMWSNEAANCLMLGVDTSSSVDLPMDYFFDEIEKVIKHNLENERKQELLKQKFAELEKLFEESSLAEVENLLIPKSSVTTDIVETVDNNEKSNDMTEDFLVSEDYTDDMNMITLPRIVQDMQKENFSIDDTIHN